MSMSSSTTMPTEEASTGSSGGTASQAAGAAQEHAGAAVDAAKQEAAQVASSAKEHARSIVESTSEELRTRGREQTDRLSSSLGSASEELRHMADASDGESSIAGVVRSLAEGAQRAARRLDEGGPEGVLEDLRRMGREHPMRFLAMAAGAGFVAARVVRSSDTEAIKSQVQESMQGQGAEQGPDELASGGSISGQVTATSGLAGSGAGSVDAPTTPLPGPAGMAYPAEDLSGRGPGA
jgi:vacuolar-type H+-ATPase subunit H